LTSFAIIIYGQQPNPFFGLTWHLLLIFTSFFVLSEFAGDRPYSGTVLLFAALSLILFLRFPSYLKFCYPSPDTTGSESLNLRAVETIRQRSDRLLPIQKQPTIYVAFSGHVNGDTQKWISQKLNFPALFKSHYVSGNLQDHLSDMTNPDFIEVADLQSKWMYQWLPSAALQPQLLAYLRQKSAYHELPPLQGRQGVLYLFEKQN
jgi:hypothetical protein